MDPPPQHANGGEQRDAAQRGTSEITPERLSGHPTPSFSNSSCVSGACQDDRTWWPQNSKPPW
jgi:hypothetical protein